MSGERDERPDAGFASKLPENRLIARRKVVRVPADDETAHTVPASP
jgi:hypothetical protein